MKFPCTFVLFLVLLCVPLASGQTFTEFPVPTSRVGPSMITAGPDGNLWFTEFNAGSPGIGRITTDGVITEFTTPTPSYHVGITAGPDGNLWYTGPSRIGRVTTSGTFTEFPIQGGTGVYGIATGPDGALWFTDYFIVSQYIRRITTSGVITVYPNGRSDTSHGVGIVAGPDGNLWFTLGSDTSPNGIGRITTSGSVTDFQLPEGSWPWYIAPGPDGALWFTEQYANKIGRITTAGEITVFPIPTPASEPVGIVAGLDGNLYFTEGAGNKIGRITTSGAITEFPIPTPGSRPHGIALGPDGAIWFTENAGNKIGRLSIGPLSGPGPVSVTLPAAASLHGAPPTFFHSDVNVFNPSATQTATVTARYRCFTGACGSAVQTFTMPPRQMRVFDDIVGTLFGAAETGGAVEFSGNVLVDSRLYTPSRPAPTVGMYVPGLSAAEAYAEAVVTSLSYSANLSTGFRTNVGVYNGNDVAQTVIFTLYNPQGVQIGQTSQQVAARTPLQINNIAGFVGIATDVPSFYCVVRGDGTSKLYVYAAVLDNQSQDLIFVRGASNTAVPAGLATLPAAASLHGAPPTFFHSDVSVFNPSVTQTATVTARYRCFTGACGNAVQTFTVPPRQMRVFDDIVGTLFGAAETGGAVEFSGNVLVDSRLYTPSRPAPTVGMYVPGLSAGEAHTEAVVTSLSYSTNLSTGFRTNVGVYNGNDAAQTVTFTLYNPQGVQIGQTSQVVPARTSVQINNIAGVVGIATDVPSFYCVVRGDGTSKLYAYAAVLDNQSQDLIFVKGAESRSP